MKNILFTLIVLSVLQSCTIEKRHYMKGFHVEWNHRNVNTHQALTFTDQQQQVIEPTDQKVKQDYTSALNPTSEKLEVSISNPPPADKRWKMSIKGVVKSAKPKSFAELKASHFKIIEREPTVPNANAKKKSDFWHIHVAAFRCFNRSSS